MTLTEKYALVCSNVTLNGKPAAIVGTRHEFAQVITMDGLSRGEWSWEAIRKIIANGGRFKL